MKRIGIALVGLFGVLFAVNSAAAEEPATAPPPTPVVVGGPTTEVVSMTSAPARRGLFPRLRARRGTYSYTSNVMMPAAGTEVVPMPMPGNTSAKPMTPVVPASGTTVVEGPATTMSSGYVTMSDTSTRPMRRGLLPRLRARLQR